MIKGLRQTTDVEGLYIGNAFIGGILQKMLHFCRTLYNLEISSNLIKELRQKSQEIFNLMNASTFVAGYKMFYTSLHTKVICGNDGSV